MTTTAANRTYIESLETRNGLSQARAESLVIHGQIPTWRENALERAGDYALAGEWSESRKFAQQFVEG
jgi:hypothetical protein